MFLLGIANASLLYMHVQDNSKHGTFDASTPVPFTDASEINIIDLNSLDIDQNNDESGSCKQCFIIPINFLKSIRLRKTKQQTSPSI